MVGRQIVYAPCKVNLHLGIRPTVDERGYHYAESVMAPVGLFDEIVIDDAPFFSVRHTPSLEVPPEKTCVWKAATMLAQELHCGLNLRIDIKVSIPEAAGLGGSSADAGAVLRALAERWGLDRYDSRVVNVARRVGADVAFFLNPQPSLFIGAGDLLAESFDELPMPVVLVKPAGAGVSARAAYKEFDRDPSEPASAGAVCEALRAGDAAAVRGLLYNNLASAAKALQPGSAEAETWLAAQPETGHAMVSGSGSCVFAICDSLEDARAVAARAKSERGWWSFATLTVGTPEKIC
ncbi:4-diphosphocytidyl-2C-methyl-D-erythritol kinase [Paratractidigestivibacter sp.]|uniref:4-(cytidine 5'-diphospho)-2-C-methyl-D-erythritol kinase n=1 Tax=Paratractidigestivibacter sp. TaxID=2847316 RepID=UPI002AC8AAE9|nr:4-diphosphocytidyl-2C-methyl-D-erythritol kinase [Paratractidigestivibacter sp.]